MSENKKLSFSTEKEVRGRKEFYEEYENCPIPDAYKLDNLSLFIRRQTLSRIIYFDSLYKKILNVHGVILLFGVRWGRDIPILINLRGLYEPYNYSRKIIGFDTFGGYPEVSEKDGKNDAVFKGAYNVDKDYEIYLERVLNYHESENPISNVKKYELIKGDAIKTLNTYLNAHPETIISMAYFDFDIYKPTFECLNLIKNHLTKGSVVAFDELGCEWFPGETVALKESFGLDKFSLKRDQMNPWYSYLTID